LPKPHEVGKAIQYATVILRPPWGYLVSLDLSKLISQEVAANVLDHEQIMG